MNCYEGKYEPVAPYRRTSPGTTPVHHHFALQAIKALRNALSSKRTPSQPLIFFNRLINSLADVSSSLEVIGNDDQETTDDEDRVLQLLKTLEGLLSWPSIIGNRPSTPFKRRDYPKLDRLVRGILSQPLNNIEILAKKNSKSASHERQAFIRSLARCLGSMNTPRGRLLKDLLVPNANVAAQSDDYSASLRLLHTTLFNCSLPTNDCNGEFQTNLRLTRAQDQSFSLFFLHRHLEADPDDYYRWKEAQVIVSLTNEASQNSGALSQRDSKLSPDRFCRLIRRKDFENLIFRAATDGLLCVRAELPSSPQGRIFMLKSSSVSLATVIEAQKLKNDYQMKTLLSYLIAKAVWLYYDTAWMAERWTKHTIHFMRECEGGPLKSQDIFTLINRPFIATHLNQASDRQGSASHDSEESPGEEFPTARHRYPRILDLAIMLLEIELDCSIDGYFGTESLDNKGRVIRNNDYFTASTILVQDKWKQRNAYSAIKEIIEICVKGDKRELGNDGTLVRDKLYTYVVAPLGQLFRNAWFPNHDPEFFLTQPIAFKATELPSHDAKQIILEGDSKSRLQELQMGFSALSDGFLMGSKEDQDLYAKRREDTDQWFRRFQKLLFTHSLLRTPRTERLKIAVLDAGINLNHPELTDEDLERISDTKSFVEGDANTDPDGHGTHVAAIILRLTKNCDLFVAKVTESEKLNSTKTVIKALHYARTIWNVHMISLSLGFETVEYPDDLNQEITECLNNGIMIYASASNIGGNGSRTYPAKYPGVICVHSATHEGNKSTFNPDPEGLDNFSFVGEFIRPTWEPFKREGSMSYKSGTSFATPVAVSVAAFMIAYIRKNMPNRQWRIKPWSCIGMQIIFRLMKKRRDNYDWISPIRYMKETNPGKIKEDLFQELC